MILEELHSTHLVIVKMKSLAKLWPGLDEQIEKLVNRCRVCCLILRDPRKSKLRPKASKVFERIHVDLCGLVKEKIF